MMEYKEQFFSHHDPEILKIVRNSVIGIAGAGGLGSNAAVSLARAGVGKMIIADFDRVEISNLNRQHYFLDQLGKQKVDALKVNLERINPYSQYEVHNLVIHRGNISEIFGNVDILIEAFDEAEMKKMLIESWITHYPEKPIIIASGLAGIGMNNKLHTRNVDNLYICGDEVSELEEGISPMAPKVSIVANMQANLAVELLVEKYGRKY